jgi:hypothetical protein
LALNIDPHSHVPIGLHISNFGNGTISQVGPGAGAATIFASDFSATSFFAVQLLMSNAEPSSLTLPGDACPALVLGGGLRRHGQVISDRLAVSGNLASPVGVA